ncbi:flagellar biosynthetic protein FliR [Yoonia sp. I 8.24]|uniref:flagellar biosynthetic protein FliR n=1 Tax=Yoonia sp. I 8.24 TaxID=1537229 RepID=UPI001EDE72E6|nr:flagellar biosynthetic protein FliR [Yoonia sp. I 8.24]MCG3269101.1 flagellar biosynthetic protein FliR [Yoonia sp. I 8.24]
MIADIMPLLPLSQSALWAGFVVFVRVSAMMAAMPAFGDQAVPLRVRLALSLAFTFIVAPAIVPSIAPFPGEIFRAFAVAVPEAITGLFLGLFLRFFILALQIAGSIAAQSTSLSQLFGGSAGVDPLPAIGHLLVVGGTALAVMLGLHVQVAAYMIQSYTMVPVGMMLSGNLVVEVGLHEVRRIFELGFSLAAPFLIASLVYNVVLGVINRAMPQLMVSFVGAPAITAGGMILLLLTAPILLGIWHAAFVGFMSAPFGPIP